MGDLEKESAPVDLSRLQAVFGDEPAEFREILDLYLAEMTRSLEELNQSIAAGEVSKVRLIAHNCVGTSANCGMTAVIGPLHRLERNARQGKLEGAGELVVEITEGFERIKLFLNERALVSPVEGSEHS
jgi:HPt (histidine-containing phosphotransfer) domain-containing protein